MLQKGIVEKPRAKLNLDNLARVAINDLRLQLRGHGVADLDIDEISLIALAFRDFNTNQRRENSDISVILAILVLLGLTFNDDPLNEMAVSHFFSKLLGIQNASDKSKYGKVQVEVCGLTIYHL